MSDFYKIDSDLNKNENITVLLSKIVTYEEAIKAIEIIIESGVFE